MKNILNYLRRLFFPTVEEKIKKIKFELSNLDFYIDQAFYSWDDWGYDSAYECETELKFRKKNLENKLFILETKQKLKK